MDIFDIIKNRKTIRRYQNKSMPDGIIEKIVEAGVWGPSVPSFLRIQPWRFVVIKNKDRITEFAEILRKKSKESQVGVNVMLSSASKIIGGAQALIVVYNSKDLDKVSSRYKEVYAKFEKIIKTAQLSAISAAIQNMILMAEELGVGSCWLDTPLFCRGEINEFLGTTDDLAAVLTLGYPAEEGKRCPRKPRDQAVKYL